MSRTIAKTHPISMDKWKCLYDLAFRIRKMAPWDWMEETDLFGIQLADAPEPAFISVMGTMGEHMAVAIYPTIHSLNQFWEMQMAPEAYRRPDLLLETRHVQVSFEPASYLAPEEKRIIKALGHSPRGGKAWPSFRSILPGHLPWVIDADEANLLCAGMEQLLDFAPRFEQDPDILPEDIGPEIPIPVQVQVGNGADAGWQETYRAFPPQPVHLNLSVPTWDLEELGGFPQESEVLEVDAAIIPMQIGESGERPRLPYLLLVVGAESGYVYGSEMMVVEDSIEQMWESFPARVLAILLRNKERPSALMVRNMWMRDLLWIFQDKAGIELGLVPELPALEEFRLSVESRL